MLMISNGMQQYAGVYLLQNYSTCFGCLSHPSSGVRQTVTAASGTGHITCQSKNLPPAWPICCKITLHVSGVYRTHRQEYIKL